MPVVVSEPMPEILARLESILKTNAPQVLAGLQAGISAAEIAKLEQQYHVQLPDDIKAIYEWHDGTRSATNVASFDFIPIHHFVPLRRCWRKRRRKAKARPRCCNASVWNFRRTPGLVVLPVQRRHAGWLLV